MESACVLVSVWFDQFLPFYLEFPFLSQRLVSGGP